MSDSDDPPSSTKNIPTSSRQEPPKNLQEYGDVTGMPLSDVPIRSQTHEERRECHQDSSFLRSKESEMRFPAVSPMNKDEEALNTRQLSFLETLNNLGENPFDGNQSNFSLDDEWNLISQRQMESATRFPAVSPMNKDEEALNSRQFSFSETLNNLQENPFDGNQSNFSFDDEWNLISQRRTGLRSSGHGTSITDSFGSGSLFSGETSVGMMTNTRNTNPASFQSVSTISSSLFQQQQSQMRQRLTSQNHMAYDMVYPFKPIHSQTPDRFQLSQFQNQYGNNVNHRQIQNFITRNQMHPMLDLQNMGSGTINSFSNLSVGVRSVSGLHGHSQSQSQGHAQMSNERDNQGGIVSGTDAAQPNNVPGGSITGNLFDGNFSLDHGWNMGNTKLIKMIPTPGFGTNTQNNPASFQPASTSSSSLEHQQQHRVWTEPQWKKILNKSDMNTALFLHIKFVQTHILKHLPKEDNEKIRENEPGITVKVYDHDTHTCHHLFLSVRHQQYILWKGWKKEFVDRRGLHKGDEIELFWDRSDSSIHFRVLSRAISKAPADKEEAINPVITGRGEST